MENPNPENLETLLSGTFTCQFTQPELRQIKTKTAKTSKT